METSEWACMSMKPGHTTWPVASITEPPANTFSNAILTSIGSRTDRVIPPSTRYSVR